MLRSARARLAVALHLTLLGLAAPATGTAQDDLIRPGDAAVNPEAIKPFHAEYQQMGTPFWLDLRLAPGERPTYSAVMTMQSFLGGLAVDHAGFYADDLGFAYRKTTFGRWGVEYLDVTESEGSIRMARMSLDPDGYPERRFVEAAPTGAMFEGTLMYWLLAALPLGQRDTFNVATLGWTETGFEEAPAEFRVVGRETLTVNGVDYNCIIVSAANAQFELRSYVAHGPPYLIRQVAIQGDTEQPVIELVRVRAEE